MIEIATIKSAVDLFEKALKFWVAFKEQKSRQYDEIFAPLFAKLADERSLSRRRSISRRRSLKRCVQLTSKATQS